jgi:hypothetical protein
MLSWLLWAKTLVQLPNRREEIWPRSRANHRRRPAPTSGRTHELPNIVYAPGDQVSMVASRKHSGTARQEGRSERNLSAKRSKRFPFSQPKRTTCPRYQRGRRSVSPQQRGLCERARGESIDSRLFIKRTTIYRYPAPGSINVCIAPRNATFFRHFLALFPSILAHEVRNLAKTSSGKQKKSSPRCYAILWNLRKFADSNNRSEKTKKQFGLRSISTGFQWKCFLPPSANLRKNQFIREANLLKALPRPIWTSYLGEIRHELE